MTRNPTQSINILMVEDDPGDVMLTKRALARGGGFRSLNVVGDGIEALRYLRKEGEFALAPNINLILLDLNMPRMDGRETLSAIKADPNLKAIPVVILTTSDAVQDIATSYNLQASCFITKPDGLDEFTRVVQAIQDFWLSIAKLPDSVNPA